MEETSDLLLWHSLKKGNKQAFEKIYRDQFGFLYNYSIKLVPDSSLVEDCIQDLFIEIWNRRESLGDTDSIRKYMTVAIRRKVIKQYQSLRNVKLTSDNEEYEFEAEMDIEVNITKRESHRENMEKLKNSFEQLSSRQKEAIYLKYYGGLSNQEIADVLDINYQSVRNLISRTLKSLSDKMKNLLF